MGIAFNLNFDKLICLVWSRRTLYVKSLDRTLVLIHDQTKGYTLDILGNYNEITV